MDSFDFSNVTTEELDLRRKNLSVKINQMISAPIPNGDDVKNGLDEVTAICAELEKRKNA